MEIPFSAVTKSRPKVTYHIRPKPYVPQKVKRDFWQKTETESLSYLSRHYYRSQQVPPSVCCPTILCICYLSHLAPSCQPCSMSLMTRQPPNLPTPARRNRKCTECDTTAFGRNRMSAESAHLSTFVAETETEAEIRSTSSLWVFSTSQVID